MSDTQEGAQEVLDLLLDSLSASGALGALGQRPRALDERLYAAPMIAVRLPDTK